MEQAKPSLIIFAVGVFLSLPAFAETHTITNDTGGFLPDYAARYSRMASNGDNLVIGGRCASACTMALIYMPREKVCALPGAKLQFHRTSGPNGSGWLMRNYPQNLSRWLDARGGLTDSVITLSGISLRGFVRSC